MENRKPADKLRCHKYKYDRFNPYVFVHIPVGTKILDIGCGTGLLGKRLREKE